MKTAARRERDRIRKQLAAEAKAEVKRLAILAEVARLEQEAKRKEIADEGVVSAVLRKPIATPCGFVLLGARVSVEGGKIARIDPVAALKLTDRQRRAARQLQTDWREVGGGLNVRAVDYLRSGGGGDPRGVHLAMRRQIDTRARLDAALTFAGAFAVILARVVLDGIPPAVWAYQEGRLAEDAPRWVAAALDRLAAFYWPPREDGPSRERILTFGPSRNTYELAEEMD